MTVRTPTVAAVSLSILAGGLIVSPLGAMRSVQDAAATTPSTTPAAEKPKTHKVSSVDMTLNFDRDGRIDSAKRAKVRLLPEAYSGSFEVAEVLKRGGRVKKGDVLLRLDSESIDKAIDEARVAADHANRRLKIAQAEQLIMKEDNITRLEQVSEARVRAEQELHIWEKYDSPDMIKQADLSMQQRENGLVDAKMELAQLEEMYSGTHLAQETKDIVLDRTRRDVKISEEYMALTKNDDTITRQFRHPQRDEQVRDALKWAKEDEAHAKIGVTTTEDRKAMDLEGAERSVKEAADRLKDLETDRGLLEVVAPADGIMTNIDLEPKDNVNGRQTVCEVLDPTDLVVKFSAQPEDLRVLLPEGDEALRQVALRLPDFPEIKLTGTITEMGEMVSAGGGGGGGEANTIPVTVKIDGALNPFVRLGLKCKVRAERTLKSVIAVPRECVTWENAQAQVKVLDAAGLAQTRAVVVGPSNDKMTMVIEGLKAGDEVVIEEKK
jgi:multidrug efflux pump subunit AcrA (membrane-fusion protein)